MRISDWSSDVCSSDLLGQRRRALFVEQFLADDLNGLRRVAQRLGEFGRGRFVDLVAIVLDRRVGDRDAAEHRPLRSEENTSELQSLMRISYAVFCSKKINDNKPVDTRHYVQILTHKIIGITATKKSNQPT